MLVHLPRAEGHGIASIEDRSCTRRLRRDRDEDRTRRDDDRRARAAAPNVDLGPRQGVPGHAVFRVETSIPVYVADPNSPGSAGRTRTPTGCCASTPPKEPAPRDGSPRRSGPSPTPSTTKPARPSPGAPPAEAFDEHLRSLQQVGVATSCAAITSARVRVRRRDTSHPTKPGTNGRPRDRHHEDQPMTRSDICPSVRTEARGEVLRSTATDHAAALFLRSRCHWRVSPRPPRL